MATQAQIMSQFDASLRKFREVYPEGRIAAEVKFYTESGQIALKVSVFRSGPDGGNAAASAVASGPDSEIAQQSATVHALKLIGIE